MEKPAVGTVIDGYRYNGGDPGSQSSWSPVGKADTVYADTIARERAKRDIQRIEAAGEAERNAYALEATADQAAAILPNTPTGFLADVRRDVGRAAPALGFLPFVPDRTETANLETLTRLGAQGSLGSVGQLKGPLSEKELAFIQSMQLNPNASRMENQRIVEAMKWASKRQAAYGRALQSWTQTLGSPSAVNAKGLSFDAWWGQYAPRAIPQPGAKPAASGQRPKPAAPRAGSKPAQGQGWKVLGVE
jgi:hypothetical protein